MDLDACHVKGLLAPYLACVRLSELRLRLPNWRHHSQKSHQGRQKLLPSLTSLPSYNLKRVNLYTLWRFSCQQSLGIREDFTVPSARQFPSE
jgi:hypothetical protein